MIINVELLGRFLKGEHMLRHCVQMCTTASDIILKSKIKVFKWKLMLIRLLFAKMFTQSTQDKNTIRQCCGYSFLCCPVMVKTYNTSLTDLTSNNKSPFFCNPISGKKCQHCTFLETWEKLHISISKICWISTFEILAS